MGLLIKIQNGYLPESAGNKALNLHRLQKAGVRIPPAFVCDWRAYHRYVSDDISLVDELRLDLTRNLDPDKKYAVRSSANIEDSVDRSFAGQFKSVLNVRGVDNVLQAIWSVWSSAQAPAVKAYLDRHQMDPRQLAMAVIIQEMVDAKASGVALSRNPVTGANEVVVEAVPGLGEALVQGGVTPQRWVNKWGNWITKTESDIPLSMIAEVVERTGEISKIFKAHVDVEWAYDGKDVYLLQSREITTLNRRNVYSNHISKEMLPGIIKPLIASINLPLVCTMWIRFMREMIGETRATADELAKTFYYRAYFNMGVLGKVFEDVGMPADSVELMMSVLPDGATKPSMKPTAKTMLRLPNMLGFGLSKWNFARPMRRGLVDLRGQLDTFRYDCASALSEKELIAETERLYKTVQQVAYYNIVGPILMGMFNSGLKYLLKRQGVDFTNFDLMEGYADLETYDPKKYLHQLNRNFAGFDPSVQERIRASSYAEFKQMEGLDDFQAGIADFIERFGHLSDNGNDFSSTPWREAPEMVLKLVVDFVPARAGEGRKILPTDIRMGPFVRAIYRRARDFRFLREQVSSLYTFGYGLFRYYYLEMGNILVRRGWLEDAQDIFYLTAAQVKDTIQSPEPLTDYRALVAHHKAEIEHYRDMPLPPVIYGDDPPPVQDSTLEKLIGIPTSIGHYTGRVVAVRGIQDFPKVKQGAVLVIPYSDVGWTPLFARAGAVVSESGGLLSHSSIVAREYNIPAVVSADGAMRLKDETLVTVNGHTGEVFIHSS